MFKFIRSTENHRAKPTEFTEGGLSTRFSAVAACALLLVAGADVRAAFEFVGNVQSTAVIRNGVECRLAPGFNSTASPIASVQIIAADAVRVRFNPTGQFTTRTSGAIVDAGAVDQIADVYDTPTSVYLVGSRLSVIVNKAPYQVIVLRNDGSVVSADTINGIGWDAETGLVVNRKYAPQGERYLGGGLRAGPLDRRGRTFFMRNSDLGGYGELSDPLYTSIPFFYTLRDGQAAGLFLDNPAIPFFDLDSANESVMTFGAHKGELDYYVFTGPTPREVNAAYVRLTGPGPLPPLWTLGYHQSRFGYASQQEMLQLAADFRERQIPCDALYFDLDYMDQLQLFTWDLVKFPDPAAMNAQLEASGFKRVNIIDPVVHEGDQLWQYLAASNYFLENAAGTPLLNDIFYGRVSWLDFTHPAARQWYKETLKAFAGAGISAVWNDLNEPAQNYMDEAVYDFGGERRSDIEARNLYALKETQATYEALREMRPDERPWVLSRSGYSGIQRYAANWSGDTLSTFDSLRVSVQMSLSMGLSGQNQFGHDVGGFLGSPSPELFIRWLEFGSLTPYFRNHAVNTSEPREPWRFGEPYTTLARDIISERYRLLPYLYTLFESASRAGDPVLAPVAFYYPQDANTHTQDREFMLGPDLLVAPVLEAGAVTRTIYLPSGARWVDRHTDQIYEGGQAVTVDAPLGRIPVFAREGAIVPSAGVRQYVSGSVSPLMTADVYEGPDNKFTLYEDDGASFAYAANQYRRTELSRRVDGSGTNFTVAKAEGNLPAAPGRIWNLRFHSLANAPGAIELNGSPIGAAESEAALEASAQGWFYRASDRLLIVRAPEDAAASVKVKVQN